jgi:hypothetical protein
LLRCLLLLLLLLLLLISSLLLRHTTAAGVGAASALALWVRRHVGRSRELEFLSTRPLMGIRWLRRRSLNHRRRLILEPGINRKAVVITSPASAVASAC